MKSDKENYRIAVVGSGYVGMAIAVLLSQKNKVIVLDTDTKKIKKINEKKSTIKDKDIDNFLINKQLDLNGTTSSNTAFVNSDYVIIATPTDYDHKTMLFDTSSVDLVVKNISKINPKTSVIIKSTVPVGYTEKLKNKYPMMSIVFSPEFLRETNALKDNLYPSRIVIGGQDKKAIEFASLLTSAAEKDNIPVLHTSSTEAEAIKLFSNTFLAMRVSFFNELDSFSMVHKLNSKKIIDAVCLDERIGDIYNNPSFGYGGYCLPKDTKQLLANYKNVPQNLITAIVKSNETRQDFIVNSILNLKPSVVGIYRLTMKKNSDNFRSSAILNIIDSLVKNKIEILIYEPKVKSDLYNGNEVSKNLKVFKEKCSVIVANRMSSNLEDVKEKCFSRDIYKVN